MVASPTPSNPDQPIVTLGEASHGLEAGAGGLANIGDDVTAEAGLALARCSPGGCHGDSGFK